MDFVEKQAVHIGYRTLWTQRTQLTIYGYHDKFFQFHFLHEENSHLIGRLASLPLTFLEKKSEFGQSKSNFKRSWGRARRQALQQCEKFLKMEEILGPVLQAQMKKRLLNSC